MHVEKQECCIANEKKKSGMLSDIVIYSTLCTVIYIILNTE